MAKQRITRNFAAFYLNGIWQEVGGEDAGLMLSEYLRRKKRLTGTKVVCAEGDCGACTVLRASPIGAGPGVEKKSERFLPINSCIVPVAQMDGSSVVTIEGVSQKRCSSPVQDALVKCHGSQCGFCTPGIVMALTALVEKKKNEKKVDHVLTDSESKNALTGNLCRCTGYQPILDAAREIRISECHSLVERYLTTSQSRRLKKIAKIPLEIKNNSFEYWAPVQLKDATRILKSEKEVRIVGAATDLGVSHNKGHLKLKKVLSLHLIEELYRVEIKKKAFLRVGARVTLGELRREIKKLGKSGLGFSEFLNFIDLFASPQIKNLATLVGNIANASPIADTPPYLLVSDSKVLVLSAKGEREISMDKFFKSYRKTGLQRGELISAVEIKIPDALDVVKLFKVSQRKDLDISAVNMAFWLKWKDRSKTEIKETRIALGGVAATPIRLNQVEYNLNGNKLDMLESVVSKSIPILQKQIHPLSDLRGTASFRRVIVENVFRKFFMDLLKDAESSRSIKK